MYGHSKQSVEKNFFKRNQDIQDIFPSSIKKISLREQFRYSKQDVQKNLVMEDPDLSDSEEEST